MHNIKNLIVGCGFSGATMARKIAEDFGEEVLVIDAKNHIGGNSYDYYDKNNICIHKYGTHIFHTNLEHVWKYLTVLPDGIHVYARSQRKNRRAGSTDSV